MLGVYDKGRPQYVDHTGPGFSEALLKGLFGKLTPHFTAGAHLCRNQKPMHRSNGSSEEKLARLYRSSSRR